MRKIHLQLAPLEKFQNELKHKGMEDDGLFAFGCVFHVVLVAIQLYPGV